VTPNVLSGVDFDTVELSFLRSARLFQDLAAFHITVMDLGWQYRRCSLYATVAPPRLRTAAFSLFQRSTSSDDGEWPFTPINFAKNSRVISLPSVPWSIAAISSGFMTSAITVIATRCVKGKAADGKRSKTLRHIFWR
jgi:hypothetical protein